MARKRRENAIRERVRLGVQQLVEAPVVKCFDRLPARMSGQ
jgi:hypothetical protein